MHDTLDVSYRADFCIGYFNLRGWQQIDRRVDEWTGGQGAQCRLLVGMQRLPQEILQEHLSAGEPEHNFASAQIQHFLGMRPSVVDAYLALLRSLHPGLFTIAEPAHIGS